MRVDSQLRSAFPSTRLEAFLEAESPPKGFAPLDAYVLPVE